MDKQASNNEEENSQEDSFDHFQSEEDDFEDSDRLFIDKLKAMWNLSYVKIILIIVIVGTFVWLGVSKCSSPPKMLNHRYVIGLDPTWYPLQLQSRSKNMTAFCETLLLEIAQKVGVQMNIIEINSKALILDFERGRFDGIVSTMLPQSTMYMAYPYIVSSPLYRLGPVLVVDASSSYRSLSDMPGRVVGLVGDARVDIGIDQYPDVIFSGYSNTARAFADLSNRKIDGVITDSLVAKSYTQGLFSGKFIISDVPLTDEGILLFLHKTPETEQFMELFNHELARMRKSGEYTKILNSWNVAE